MSIESKVERYATRLDLHDPSWYWRVNPWSIDLMDNDYCVLGQAFGHFTSPDAKAFMKQWARGFFTLSPFIIFRKEQRKRAEVAWNREVSRRRVAAFDDRARVLRKRDWLLATAGKAEREATKGVKVHG